MSHAVACHLLLKICERSEKSLVKFDKTQPKLSKPPQV